MKGYADQDRGSADDYEKYFQGMDKSMRQKIALISSYFPVRGRVADMGSGSGSGSHDLAGLYPSLSVIGVDVNPRSVDYSRAKYRRENLEYLVGDIADPVFPAETLDGILNSSVLHHVTSFNDFSTARVRELFDHQVAELKPEGILAVRDFVVPNGPERIVLELPDDDAPEGETEQAGATPDDAADEVAQSVERLSSAALFEKFAREFRSSRYPQGGLAYERLEAETQSDAAEGTGRRVRFGLGYREAVEFVLRKDYRRDWAVEILEEYTYFTRAEFEAEYRRRGLRIILSREIWNPWIVRNRFEGRFRLLDGARELDPPPTNYIIVGQKAPRGGGVYLRPEEVLSEDEPRYLRLEHYRESTTDRVWDLVSRPEPVLDIVPYLDLAGEIAVVGRQCYPRPILQTGRPLDEAFSSGYINEPISVVLPSRPDRSDADDDLLRELLQERAGIAAGAVIATAPGLTYYPSPGGINEKVQARFARLADETALGEARSEGSGFSTSGDIRLFHAAQTLRACQVGGMFDARLELNIYDLLLRLGRSPGPYIGSELETDAPGTPPPGARYESFEDLYLDRFGAEATVFAPTPRDGDFLRVLRARFVEENAAGEGIAERELEYVLPRHWSERTVAFLPYVRDARGRFWIGLEERFLPAPFIQTGSARLFACPAWRLPTDVHGQRAALAFARRELRARFGADCQRPVPLGGSYCPSPGLTPETVSPFAALVSRASLADSRLIWTPLDELLANRERLADGHLLIALFRFWHAAGE